MFKTSGNWGYLIERPSIWQSVNAICYSLFMISLLLMHLVLSMKLVILQFIHNQLGSGVWCISNEGRNSTITYYSFIPLACAECEDSLPFTGASSIPLLYNFYFHPFPPTSLPSSLTSSCHLFLGLPLSLVSKFIYNTFGNSVFLHSLYMSKPT